MSLSTTGVPYAQHALHAMRGCTKASPGCANCYSLRLCATRLKNSPHYKGLAEMCSASVVSSGKHRSGRPRWTGEVRLCPDELAKPLTRKKPTTVFVCDMGDLFHPEVPFEFIVAVFGVMAATPHITYLLLTKRAARMAEFYRWLREQGSGEVVGGEGHPLHDIWVTRGLYHSLPVDKPTQTEMDDLIWSAGWPLPNCWPGVTCEDQEHFAERALHLLTVPTHEKAGKWLSLEPQLGAIDLDPPTCQYCRRSDSESIGLADDGATPWCIECDSEAGFSTYLGDPDDGISLVIQGSEQLAGARSGRHFDVEWAVQTHKQCQEAGVAYYLKQLPGPGGKVDKEPQLYGRMWRQLPWEAPC